MRRTPRNSFQKKTEPTPATRNLDESTIETLEIVSDADMMKALRRGIREIETGKGIPWEKVKEDLGM